MGGQGGQTILLGWLSKAQLVMELKSVSRILIKYQIGCIIKIVVFFI